MKDPDFYFAIISLSLMVLGFLLQEISRIPFVEAIIAKEPRRAKEGFESLKNKGLECDRSFGFGGDLKGKPRLRKEDDGFSDLAEIYAGKFKKNLKKGEALGIVSEFVDTRALVPGRDGNLDLVIVLWAHGVKTESSYQELELLIDKSYSHAILPWKYSLFSAGFILALIAFIRDFILS